jgi:uncharacterized circularly permuted ATP-grasp superfamily protein
VTLVNAPGTGIADDKSIYTYIPDVIEFYTGEKPLLKNVPTWRCGDPKQLSYVLDHLPELVVKEVHGSGGYGMLVGPTSSKKEIEAFRARLKARPKNYIAQPTLALSSVPTFTNPAWRRAMSTSGPSCSRATRCASRPAGSPASR